MHMSNRPKGWFLCLAALCLAAPAWSQNIVGLRPSVTVEPEYPQGTFDVNIAPLCAELALNGSGIALRADLLLTLQLGNGTPTFQNIGILAGLPWYPFSGSTEPHTGFFIGPKAGLSYNVSGGFWSTGPAIELGWAFDLERFVLLVCAEGGATVFLRSGETPRLSGHGGLSCILGMLTS